MLTLWLQNMRRMKLKLKQLSERNWHRSHKYLHCPLNRFFSNKCLIIQSINVFLSIWNITYNVNVNILQWQCIQFKNLISCQVATHSFTAITIENGEDVRLCLFLANASLEVSIMSNNFLIGFQLGFCASILHSQFHLFYLLALRRKLFSNSKSFVLATIRMGYCVVYSETDVE